MYHSHDPEAPTEKGGKTDHIKIQLPSGHLSHKRSPRQPKNKKKDKYTPIDKTYTGLV